MLNGLIQGIVDWLRETYLEPLVRSLRREAAGYVEEGARAARRVVLLLGLLIFVITLIGAGLVLVPIALLLFMPWSPQTKAFVGLSVGLLYLLIPVVPLLWLFSERRWMRVTGADELARKLRK